MTEPHPTYPNAIQALLLIALLMAIELLVAAAVFDADLLAGINDGDVYGFITVVGNGILFVGLMAYSASATARCSIRPDIRSGRRSRW